MRKLTAAALSLMVMTTAYAATAQGAPTAPQGQTQEEQRDNSTTGR
jgi:hypothetical protein